MLCQKINVIYFEEDEHKLFINVYELVLFQF